MIGYVDPYSYLVDVLQRLESHPSGRVRELTPRVWKEKFGGNPIPDVLSAGVVPQDSL